MESESVTGPSVTGEASALRLKQAALSFQNGSSWQLPRSEAPIAILFSG